MRRGYGRAENRDDALKRFTDELRRQKPPWEVAKAVAAARHYWYWRDRKARLERSAKSGREERAEELLRELLKRCREVLRLQHKSYRTEQSYLAWVRRFLSFYESTPPRELEAKDARHFLTYLAIERRVAAATQEQAFNALLFFFRHVLERSIDGLASTVKAKRGRKLPVVLSPEEVRGIIDLLEEPYSLMVRLMYAAGLRLRECLQIRIMDLTMETETLMIRGAKGDKDRPGLLPHSLHPEVERQVKRARRLYDEDRRLGSPGVPLPDAFSI